MYRLVVEVAGRGTRDASGPGRAVLPPDGELLDELFNELLDEPRHVDG
jgi:hypothetical protein